MSPYNLIEMSPYDITCLKEAEIERGNINDKERQGKS